jgi:hypothetical protein
MTDPKNLRTEERKKFHCTAHLLRTNCPVISGRTIDISTQGISLTVADQLEAGDGYIISFENVLNGKKFKVTARATVVYSILSGSAFRTGLKFVLLDASTEAEIRAIMRLLFS